MDAAGMVTRALKQLTWRWVHTGLLFGGRARIYLLLRAMLCLDSQEQAAPFLIHAAGRLLP